MRLIILFVTYICISGDMIDLKFCYGYKVGETDVLHGELDGISYDVFCMKEEDYVMKIMATYGTNCPPMRKRKSATRTLANGTKVEFDYIEPIANHFDFRHCVDDNNHLRHMRPSIEETWKTHRWVLRVLAFFLAVSEANTFCAYRHFVWNKWSIPYYHKFRRGLSIEMMENTLDEEDEVEDSNNEPRRSPRQTTANNHELRSAPKHCTKWNVNEGWVKNCQSAYQQVRCSTGCHTQTRKFCSCNPGTFYCQPCHVQHVHFVLSGGGPTDKMDPRTVNPGLNML